MNKKKRHIELLPVLGAMLLFSCVEKEPLMIDCPQDGDPVPVTVSLQLTLDDEVYGTPLTRAVDDPGSAGDTQIQNLCIFQFAGTADDARMVGLTHYYTRDADPDDPEHYLRDDFKQIKLSYSEGDVHTLVIVTNTFRQLPEVETLGDMLSLYRSVEAEADMFGHEGADEGFPNDQNYYQRMNAIAVMEVNNDDVVKATLRRSMARVNVTIDNTGADGLQIRKVWLRNVSQKDYYVTDYSYFDEHDQVQLLRSTPFRDEYDPAFPMRGDYPARTWEDGGGTNSAGTGTGTATYRWYVPCNMRGTDESVTLTARKNESQLTLGATYLYILARQGSDADGDGLGDELMEYRFYLGENEVNNFDLRPNTSYSYHFTFDGKGLAETDGRALDLGKTDFDVDANCYIVNPPLEGVRKYSFNVVHRPNIFWGSPKEGDRYGLRSQYPDHFIGTDETWYARVLWSDYPYTTEQVNAVLSHNTGTGAGGYMDISQRVELTIPADLPEGNMIIGVCTDSENGADILWSWHVWITKYQPDDIEGHAPEADTFVYHVEGGEVHRYNNAAFNTGTYKNGYAMDRNLGALDQKYRTTRGLGFYYQFGRKDPFPGNYTVYTYQFDGTRTAIGGDPVPKVQQNSTGQGGKNVPYAVLHPRTFIQGSGSWTYNDIFNPSQYNSLIRWQDPMNTYRTDNEEAGANKDKSFFDPCPSGWRVPDNGWVSDFVGDGAGSSTTNTSVTCQWGVENVIGTNRGTGSTYFPYGFLEAKNHNFEGKYAQTAFFPAAGYRIYNYSGQDGRLLNLGKYGKYGQQIPNGTGAVYHFFIYVGGSYAAYTNYCFQVEGASIRCVRK